MLFAQCDEEKLSNTMSYYLNNLYCLTKPVKQANLYYFHKIKYKILTKDATANLQKCFIAEYHLTKLHVFGNLFLYYGKNGGLLMANDKFNLDEELLKAIAISISEGIGIDFVDARKQLDTFTKNSSPTLIWDLINSNLKNRLGQDYACIYKKQRGIWEFLLIIDKKSKKVITVMRENRLRSIIKHPYKNKKHYAAALALLNENLKPRQRKLVNIPLNSVDNEFLQELSQELCSEIEQNMLKESLYCILSFKSSSGVMTAFSANYLTRNLEISETISLNDFIPKKNYDAIVADTKKPEDVQDIPLTLKPAAYFKKQAKEEIDAEHSIEIKAQQNENPAENTSNGDE
ncbi:hypothetical protein J6Q66_06430 [bacterium]|nr:hypothetical protein [bacterium]